MPSSPLESTTPVSITPAVVDLCRKIRTGTMPVFVPVSAVAGYPPNECYVNVDQHVRLHGGEVAYGWMIWESSGVIVEGVFHAVWKNGDELIDVTPKDDGEKQILFLRD